MANEPSKESSSNGSLVMLAYERSGEIEWARVNAEDPWFPYFWKNGKVFSLPFEETRPKRHLGSDGTYLDNIRQSICGVPTAPW